MKISLFIASLLISSSSYASVVCHNGPVNSIAKATCTNAVSQLGRIAKIAEGYGAIGFNQYTQFCMAMTDGQVCDCSFSFAGSPATGPQVSCSKPDGFYNYADCVSLMREDCKN